jgi:Metal-dependent hydrolases of the beta-lactamase superfamily I
LKKIAFILLFFGYLNSTNLPYVVVLGIAQDGGLPHAGCLNNCCKSLWVSGNNEKVASIGIVDPKTGQSWLIDATPDFASQLHVLENIHKTKLSGIFLTHAHIGHYSGLLQLGREVMGAKDMPVYAMPRMKSFLYENSPWNQLLSLENIKIIDLKNSKEIKLSSQLYIEPFLVPHRDEFSETVGYRVVSNKKSLVYIPDIDKWSKWDQDIFQVVLHSDFALLDGTFYSSDEIPHRDMSEIPHPFIIETMGLLENMNSKNRKKIYFIHFNHSNPAINYTSSVSNIIRSKRFNIAKEGLKLNL